RIRHCCRTFLTGGSSLDDRSALPAIAGALRRSLLVGGSSPRPFGPEAPGSIPCRRRSGFHQPPDLSADARRVLVPFVARIRLGRESRHRGSEASTAALDPRLGQRCASDVSVL